MIDLFEFCFATIKKDRTIEILHPSVLLKLPGLVYESNQFILCSLFNKTILFSFLFTTVVITCCYWTTLQFPSISIDGKQCCTRLHFRCIINKIRIIIKISSELTESEKICGF